MQKNNKMLFLLLFFVIYMNNKATIDSTCLCPEKFNSTPYPEIAQGKKYVIGAWHAGFFSSFFATLSHLEWCDKHNKTPVVYWNKASMYYQPEGYNDSTNVWEYYFEPVSDLKYEEGDKIFSWYYTADNTCFTPWTIHEETRKHVYEIIQKYVKIKPILQNKIDTFYKENMHNKTTIGIHIRGSDKSVDEPPVPLEKITDYANTFANENTQFLLATDDIKIFQEAKKMLKGKVIFYDAYRTPTSQYAWFSLVTNKAQQGEEVLIEVLLLSQCNMFLHTHMSNVSQAVLCFNPLLEHKVFRATDSK